MSNIDRLEYLIEECSQISGLDEHGQSAVSRAISELVLALNTIDEGIEAPLVFRP